VVAEAVQNYVSMVSGLTRMTREKALGTARSLLAQAGLDEVAADAQERVSKLADEILQTGKANRDLLEKFVAAEVDKAAGRLGFARTDDVEELRHEIASLRHTVAQLAGRSSEPTAERPGPDRNAAGNKSAAKKTAAARAAARRTTPAAEQGPTAPAAATEAPDK
jgi:polyhydroxyalkanoate synthesis regulator phasin